MKFELYVSAYLIPEVCSLHLHAKKPLQTFVELARRERVMTTREEFHFI